MLQEKDKLLKMVETEIERLKEEIWQQKDREDGVRSQINRCLKKKKDFKKLYRDHKHLEAEHKKLGSNYDRQQENLKVARMELKEKMETLMDQHKMMIASVMKVLKEAVKERIELTSKHHEELERLKRVLDRV